MYVVNSPCYRIYVIAVLVSFVATLLQGKFIIRSCRLAVGSFTIGTYNYDSRQLKKFALNINRLSYVKIQANYFLQKIRIN